MHMVKLRIISKDDFLKRVTVFKTVSFDDFNWWRNVNCPFLRYNSWISAQWFHSKKCTEHKNVHEGICSEVDMLKASNSETLHLTVRNRAMLAILLTFQSHIQRYQHKRENLHLKIYHVKWQFFFSFKFVYDSRTFQLHWHFFQIQTCHLARQISLLSVHFSKTITL